MERDERNQNPRERFRLRLFLYSIIFAAILIPPVVEMKTGIRLGARNIYRTPDRFHDPLSWEAVWAQLPFTLLPYLVIAVTLITFIEWSIRRKMQGVRSILDSESETNESRPKRFTARWRIATIAYSAAIVIALYAYSKGDWSSDLPPLFPLVAFSPIFVSLGLLAIYTGEFRLKGGTFYRSKTPIKYWVCVATMLLIGTSLLLAGIGVMGT
ncbi:MAG TPA: hypothetical protein VGS96_13725 [Thermoanaerobaculia bacterium]|jgi:hypothetical protein|nr:hypothetical protein [Thermoanaerobaculia bacterium]